MNLHLTARSTPNTLLFRDHVEGRALFDLVAGAFPDADAFCLMPDHIHVIVASDEAGGRLHRVMRGFARWRNTRRRETGVVWAPAPPPEAVRDGHHLRRTIRYVHLNPCRKELVADPLEWPWSTHRDMVGMAIRPVVPRTREPSRFHAFVSGDPSVAVEGTPLPEESWGTARWETVRDGVASAGRLTREDLASRGVARTLAVQAAWLLQVRDVEAIGTDLGLSPSSVWRIAATTPTRASLAREPALRACLRAIGDSRFSPLWEGDLRRAPGWERYRSCR